MGISGACRFGMWCVLLWCLPAAQAQAAADAGTRTIQMSEAVARTLAGNPALKAQGYAVDAERGRITQAELKPNPELGLLVENVLGTGELGALDLAETTLSLGWILERGKRGRRVEAAQAGMAVVEADAEVLRRAAAAETAHRFLDCLAMQRRLDFLDAAVELSEEVVRTTGRRVQAGQAPRADLSRAEAEAARMRLQRDDLEHELLTAYYWLAAQWGESHPDFDRVEGELEPLPQAVPFSALVRQVERNPELQRHLAEQRAREADLRLEEARAKPDWRVTAGVRRFEFQDDYAFVAGLTLPLATRNRNQGRIAEAHARVDHADASQEARRVAIETELFDLHQALVHNLHRAELLQAEVLPRTQQALTDTERAYEAGGYGYLELIVVQREVLDTRIALLQARADAHHNAIEIERLTGSALQSGELQP